MAIFARALSSLWLAAAMLAPPSSGPRPAPRQPTASELALPQMTPIGHDVWVGQVAPGVWVTSFTHEIEGGVISPANGLVFAAGGRSVLVDPGWDSEQTRAILNWANGVLKLRPAKAIVTHSHEDRSAGVGALQEAKVPVFALKLTRDRLKKLHRPLPEAVEGLNSKPLHDPLGFQLFHPGPGHAPDNLVVWLPQPRLLFGGCLLKSTTTDVLGNVADASLALWPQSLRNVRRAFPDAAIQVPGHGAISGDALAHTAALLERQSR